MEPATPVTPAPSQPTERPVAAALSETEIRALCEARGNRPDALIEILHDVQARVGWIDASAPRVIADALNLSRADVHGVISFYSDFRRTAPAPHRIQLCRAEACRAVGSEPLARELEQTFQQRSGPAHSGGNVELEAVYCLGNCALGPAALVDGQLLGRASAQRILQYLAAAPDGDQS